jgi:hypothetical protein
MDLDPNESDKNRRLGRLSDAPLKFHDEISKNRPFYS